MCNILSINIHFRKWVKLSSIRIQQRLPALSRLKATHANLIFIRRTFKKTNNCCS